MTGYTPEQLPVLNGIAQSDRDYETFAKAVRTGRHAAATGI